MADEVEITEITDMNVIRQDAVVNPASGFTFLIKKSAAADSTEEPAVEDAIKDAPVEGAPTETPEPVVEKAEGEVVPALTAESVQELIKAALAERDSKAEELLKSANAEIETLKSALDVLKATPIPGGPVISATADQRAIKAKTEAGQRAAYYERLAKSVNDRELAVEYTRLAKAAQAEAA